MERRTRKYADTDSHGINDVDNAVKRILKEGFRNGKIPPGYLHELGRKTNDPDFIERVEEAYYEKLTTIRRRAMKFTKLIENKYGSLGYPLHIVLNKSLKYKTKYNLSEPEFELFQQYYYKNLNVRDKGRVGDILTPNTNMFKVFGDPSSDEQLHVSESDNRILSEILQLYISGRAIYSQVVVQSLLYDNSDLEKFALGNASLKFDMKTQDGTSYIDPVIAAMFLKKIKKFDEYFLFSNLSEIVKTRAAGEPLSTFNNYILLFNLVTEPTDIVCSSASPIVDIRNRIALQLALYKNVLNLRQGRYYDTISSAPAAEFRTHVDHCRISNYDAPDFLMYGDESVILRRLINSFAFRSVVVVTSPVSNVAIIGTVTAPVVSTQVIKVPMLNLRLPIISGFIPNPAKSTNLGLPGTVKTAYDELYPENIHLNSALHSVQIVFINGRFEPRLQAVIHVDDVIIFNVPRRTYQPLMNAQQMFLPTNWTSLPKHVFGLEKINEFKVIVPQKIELNKTEFNITSAVILKTKEEQFNAPNDNNDKTTFVIGCKTFFFTYKKATTGNPLGLDYVYDPDVKYGDTNTQPFRRPNTNLGGNDAYDGQNEASDETSCQQVCDKGVIFIFSKDHHQYETKTEKKPLTEVERIEIHIDRELSAIDLNTVIHQEVRNTIRNFINNHKTFLFTNPNELTKTIGVLVKIRSLNNTSILTSPLITAIKTANTQFNTNNDSTTFNNALTTAFTAAKNLVQTLTNNHNVNEVAAIVMADKTVNI
jgi:hypothetical protein